MDFLAQILGITSVNFSNLNHQDGRRALIYLLGNNNNAIIAADILIYLLYQTLSTPSNLLEQYDGYIVRTYQQIEMETGCSNLMNCKAPMKLLKDSGLVETNNKAQKRRTCYRVNTDLLILKLDEALEHIGVERRSFYEEFFDVNEDKVDWENINNLVDEASNDDEKLEELISLLGRERMYDIPMMFYVDKYWKERFGVDYKWNRAEYNTLSYHLTGKGKNRFGKEHFEILREAIFSIDRLDGRYPAKLIVDSYKKKQH